MNIIIIMPRENVEGNDRNLSAPKSMQWDMLRIYNENRNWRTDPEGIPYIHMYEWYGLKGAGERKSTCIFTY